MHFDLILALITAQVQLNCLPYARLNEARTIYDTALAVKTYLLSNLVSFSLFAAKPLPAPPLLAIRWLEQARVLSVPPSPSRDQRIQLEL